MVEYFVFDAGVLFLTVQESFCWCRLLSDAQNMLLLLVQEEVVGAVTMLLLVKEFLLLLAQDMLCISAVAIGIGS